MRPPQKWLLFLTVLCMSSQALAAELRAVRFEVPSLFNQAPPAEIVERVASIRFNTLMCTVQPEGLRDARLPDMISLAHARQIRVHGVVSTMLAGHTSPSPPKLPDPSINAVNSSGETVTGWLCPSKVQSRRRAIQFAESLVRLGVDGVQLDYIRFGAPDVCFCDTCRHDSAEWLRSNPGRTWEDWRDSVITSLAQDVRQAARDIKPDVVFSCSTWTAGPGQPRSYLTPEGEGYGWRQGQDFLQLAGVVDFLRPMLYSCMLRQTPTWIVDMTRLAVGNAAGKTRIVPGIALTIEEPWKQCHISSQDLVTIVQGVRAAGASGIALFSYASLFDPKYRFLGYAEALRPLFQQHE